MYVNSCKFIVTKESIRNDVDTHRTGLGYQHDRRFISMGHQHDGRDVMWKGSIDHERSQKARQLKIFSFTFP